MFIYACLTSLPHSSPSPAALPLLYQVRGIGDESLGELLPWLLDTLQSESSAVDRSGAAQGLSEVLLAQGFSRLSQLMPRFIESSQDPENPTHVRDGYLMLFVYLPITFGDDFTPFLADLLPCILKVSHLHISVIVGYPD